MDFNITRKVRAFYRAVEVEGFDSPYNTLFLKVFYPAKFEESEEVLNLGVVPVEEAEAPFPVVIFLSGVNVSAASYQWLGERFAENGIVFVSFDWVAEALPGDSVGLTPGVDLSAMTPETYGTKPATSAVSAILRELENIQDDSLLSGLLDLEKIVLGGHSAGGSLAIMNAHHYENVVGAFSYGSHSQGATMLGFEPDTFLALDETLPVFIAGGDNDGVISSSVKRYGKVDGDCVTPLAKTFEAGLGGESTRYLAIFKGSNHFLITNPTDETAGRSYLDNLPGKDVSEKREALGRLILNFIKSECLDTANGSDLVTLGEELTGQNILTIFKQS